MATVCTIRCRTVRSMMPYTLTYVTLRQDDVLVGKHLYAYTGWIHNNDKVFVCRSLSLDSELNLTRSESNVLHSLSILSVIRLQVF